MQQLDRKEGKKKKRRQVLTEGGKGFRASATVKLDSRVSIL